MNQLLVDYYTLSPYSKQATTSKPVTTPFWFWLWPEPETLGLGYPNGALLKSQFWARKLVQNGAKQAKDGPKRLRTAPGGPWSGSMTRCGQLGAHGTQLGHRSTRAAHFSSPIGACFGAILGAIGRAQCRNQKKRPYLGPDSLNRDSEGTCSPCTPQLRWFPSLRMAQTCA